MLGAIAGDIIGSVYEHFPIKTTDFPLFDPHCRFTDDTVMTLAVAQAILQNLNYGVTMKQLGLQYPHAGYGQTFAQWLSQPGLIPYNSWGNGAAMRVSPIGFAFDTTEDVLREAEKSAAVSHNHPEGIKGAQATALAILLARQGASKDALRQEISQRFGYHLQRTIEEIRPTYTFDVSCQDTVPEAIIAFLDSHDYESAVRNAISLGGDSDTLACIAGGLAHAYYKDLPSVIVETVRHKLPVDLWAIVAAFNQQYPASAAA